MPLLRGIARTAVVAGTATAVSNRVSRRQTRRWGEEDSGYGGYEDAPPEPATVQPDKLDQLSKLGELKATGVLTDAEFEAQKAKILAG
jgi:hypothetical protein